MIRLFDKISNDVIMRKCHELQAMKDPTKYTLILDVTCNQIYIHTTAACVLGGLVVAYGTKDRRDMYKTACNALDIAYRYFCDEQEEQEEKKETQKKTVSRGQWEYNGV